MKEVKIDDLGQDALDQKLFDPTRGLGRRYDVVDGSFVLVGLPEG